MNNLIHAELYRYKNSLLFWFALCASIVTGVVFGLTVVTSQVFDDMFIIPLSIVLAAFLSLSIGRDYADGTIRNKIIAGKTKTVIYISRVYISIIVSTILIVAFLIPFTAITFTSVLSKIPTPFLLWVLLGFILLNFVWAIIFTVVSTLISSREIASIINFVLIMVIMLGAYQVEHMIGQPKFIQPYSAESSMPMTPEEVKQAINNTYNGSYYTESDENGVITYYKLVESEKDDLPNPKYIENPLRTVLQNVGYMLPHGQINSYVSSLTSVMYTNGTEDSEAPIQLYPLYSLFLLVVLTATGLVAFRKKDLK